MKTQHKLITPEKNPAGIGDTLAEAIADAADAYSTTAEIIEAALNLKEGPDCLIHVVEELPEKFDRYSAIDRSIGRRVTLSFEAWLEKCERSDAWHDSGLEPTLANVKAWLDDYSDWQQE